MAVISIMDIQEKTVRKYEKRCKIAAREDHYDFGDRSMMLGLLAVVFGGVIGAMIALIHDSGQGMRFGGTWSWIWFVFWQAAWLLPAIYNFGLWKRISRHARWAKGMRDRVDLRVQYPPETKIIEERDAERRKAFNVMNSKTYSYRDH